MEYKIVNLSQKPEILDRAARWFHEKWEVPLEAYRESMEESLLKKAPVPQWYLALKDSEIIGGMGVIENDFHHRKDLAPNVCAVYTEAEYRNHGVAGALLDYVCRDMKELQRHERKRNRYLISYYRPYFLLRKIWLGILLHGPG